jgi:hypothetical protein
VNGDISPAEAKRSLSQPAARVSPPKGGEGSGAAAPHVPPKIDRQKKPSRRSGNYHQNGSSEGGGEAMYGGKASSLERNSHLRDTKMVSAKPPTPTTIPSLISFSLPTTKATPCTTPTTLWTRSTATSAADLDLWAASTVSSTRRPPPEPIG